LAETGSGKTGAFALPMLQALLITPQKLFGLVLTPTRELAYQIQEQFEALGASIGIKCGRFLFLHHLFLFYDIVSLLCAALRGRCNVYGALPF